MNRSIYIIISALIACIVLTSDITDNNGKAGYTGSPGEATCNTSNCHNSYALNTGNGSISATCNMIYWLYEPFITYTISIKVAKPGVHLFGFAAEILNSSNINAGTIVVSDNIHTQIKSRTVSGATRRNIVHKLNGGSSVDSAIFTFNWTSPDTITGPITMYFVGNASNASGNVAGDYIYSASKLILPAQGDRINDLITTDGFSVYPNPATENISLHYFLPKNEKVEVKLYDLTGSFSHLLMDANKTAGENNETLAIPADCKSGLYLLSLEAPSGRVNRKLIIN